MHAPPFAGGASIPSVLGGSRIPSRLVSWWLRSGVACSTAYGAPIDYREDDTDQDDGERAQVHAGEAKMHDEGTGQRCSQPFADAEEHRVGCHRLPHAAG